MVSLSDSSLKGSIALSMMIHCILNEEARRKEQRVSSHNENLIMKRKKRSKYRDSQSNSDDGRAKSWGRSKS